MKCFHCHKKIIDESKMIILGADGDAVCDEICYEGYKAKKEHFLDKVVHSEYLTNRWLGGEDFPEE
jgi:hypothetical protein